jgi:glucosyl-dolichyl phosphate glucuronosyltransferase
MNVTVILCTFNRCRELSGVLNSLSESQLPASVDWEVLVVDNNSTDRTREVVDEFSRRFPGRFRYVFESKSGKSFALNTGISEARGEILAFVDDDVTVEPGWLNNLTARLKCCEWAGSGGRTLPAHPYPSPRWMSVRLAGVLYAHFDLGDAPQALDRAPYGVNMAFRKSMFEKYGLFRTDMGPSANSEIPRPNEDTEFGRRLMAAGERLRYEPSAVVYHPVSVDRLKKEYFLAWWFDFGRATMREVGRRPDIWGIPRPYLSMLKYITVLVPQRTLTWLLTLNDPALRFYRKCWVWEIAGEVVEVYRRSFSSKAIVGDAITQRSQNSNF